MKRAPAPPPEAVPISGATPGRLLSLDAFRGLTIAGMLLVNNPGSWSAIHPPLRHAEWHGWTPTDLIFPFFLFIVGVSLVFSFEGRVARGAGRGDLLGKAAKRSAILFGLGLVLHGFPSYDLSAIRIPGVLQRIAVAYLAASVIVLYTRGWRSRAAWLVALLLGYWAALELVPVPGAGAGVLEPGQDLGAWIDRAVFGTEHLWTWSRTWDPEGLLSTVPAVGSVLAGVLAGQWLRGGRSRHETAAALFVAGAVAVVAGWAWGLAFPINKNLWTSSYTVFTAGLGLQALALCYWLIDVKGLRRWALPFVVFGTNAIAAYFLSSLAARALTLVTVGGDVALKTWLYQTLFAAWMRPVDASLAYALAYVLLWLGLMALLYRRRIFIKV